MDLFAAVGVAVYSGKRLTIERLILPAAVSCRSQEPSADKYPRLLVHGTPTFG